MRDKKGLYVYNIKIPLIYNKFDIISLNPNSEFRFDLDGVAEENIFYNDISVCENNSSINEEIKIRLYCTHDKNYSSSKMPNPFIICEVEGIIAENRYFDIEKIVKIIDTICKRLSFIFNRHNYNRHLFQPKIEANWGKMEIYYKKYNNNDDATMSDDIENKVTCSIYSTMSVKILPNEIHIAEWLKNNNSKADFVCNEYYTALGSENIKSKFFHLFSIIEFCEHEYESYNNAKKLVEEDEIDNIMKKVKSFVFNDSNKKEKILSRVKQNLNNATDIGRAKKLFNILQWMNIKSYEQCGKEIYIDENLLNELIKLRNKLFHGGLDKGTKTINYGTAVQKLLYIDEKILDFVMNYKH